MGLRGVGGTGVWVYYKMVKHYVAKTLVCAQCGRKFAFIFALPFRRKSWHLTPGLLPNRVSFRIFPVVVRAFIEKSSRQLRGEFRIRSQIGMFVGQNNIISADSFFDELVWITTLPFRLLRNNTSNTQPGSGISHPIISSHKSRHFACKHCAKMQSVQSS